MTLYTLADCLLILMLVVGALTGDPALLEGWPEYDAYAAQAEGATAAAGDVILGIIVLAYAFALIRFWRKGVGLRWAHRVAGGSALKPRAENLLFWNSDSASAIVTPKKGASMRTKKGEPRSPQGYAEGISGMAERLSGPAFEIGIEAAAVARDLFGSIEVTEHEIERLAKDVTPGELRSVSQKLKALGPVCEDESEDQRRMRELSQNQLELLQRLDRRLENAKERRARMLQMLQTLWLQVAELRAQAAEDSSRGTEVTGKILAICGDIREYVSAHDETTKVLRVG
jgi:hypothetical protein